MNEPRPLPAARMRTVVASGTAWAWQLEAKLSGVYETLILEAYDGAATALEARSEHLTAAAPGWSVPDEDEIGDALRKKYEERADDASTAIRVEAMRRVTKKGLEMMHVNLEAVNPLLHGVLEQLGGNIQIADTTRRDIMHSLAASWKDGDSIPKAARNLRATGAEVSKSRATLIARTELIGAINAGAHALGTISNQYTPDGEPGLLKIWLTADDEKVRDTHVQAGDEYGPGAGIPLDEPFQVGDSEMQFPGDQDGAAEEVCNCRCALSYEEGALTASMENPVITYTFKGRKLRATGALTASGVEVFAIAAEDLPEAVEPYEPETEEAAVADDVPMVALDRSWTAVLAITGEETSDGRMIAPGGLRWRELPLTLTMQFELAPEHMGALIVGRIDEVEIMPAAAAVSAGLLEEKDGGYASDAEAIIGRGVWDDSMTGDEAMRLVADEMQRGVSLDFAPDSVEVVELAPAEGETYGRLLELWPSGELMGATVCAHPAFSGAVIRVEPAVITAATVYPGNPGALVPMRIWTRAVIHGAKPPTLVAAAVDHSDGCMVACHPTTMEAGAIAQPGGQPAGDLHVTLAYLPNPPEDFSALHGIVAKVASDHATIPGKVSGAGYFAPADDAKPAAPVEPASSDDDGEEAPEDKAVTAGAKLGKAFADGVTAAADPPTPGPVADPETPADSEDTDGDGAPEPLHPHVALVDAPGLGRMRAALCTALDDAGIAYAENHDFVPHLTLGYEAQPSAPAMSVAGAPLTFSHLSVHEGPTRTDHPMSDVEPDGLTASAAGLAPVEPPAAWFTDPELHEPTPLTITPEGQIFGHLATWGTCHVGIRDACVQPPSSELDYALFHLGHVMSEEGELVPCGKFTMDTGHAPLRDQSGRPVEMAAAMAHYDNTGTAVCDVRCGEDDHGIWFAGAIRPDLSASKVRALRAAQISGDWRAHEGRREFCAGLAVNVPGFPVVRPRTAIAASGQVLALVAAGVDLRVAEEPLATRRLAAMERLLPGYGDAQRELALERLLS